MSRFSKAGSRMYPVLLVGAGKIGSAVAKFLVDSGDYDVLVIDQDAATLARVGSALNVKTMTVDVANAAQLAKAMAGRKSVLSAVTYQANADIARGALEHGLSYFDLTEDVETTKITRAL